MPRWIFAEAPPTGMVTMMATEITEMIEETMNVDTTTWAVATIETVTIMMIESRNMLLQMPAAMVKIGITAMTMVPAGGKTITDITTMKGGITKIMMIKVADCHR
jgi:hypothetical protein